MNKFRIVVWDCLDVVSDSKEHHLDHQSAALAYCNGSLEFKRQLNTHTQEFYGAGLAPATKTVIEVTKMI
jgi:hypothetical protein